MRMDVVGPTLWRGLHAITFDFPADPTPPQQHAAIALFESLQELLPCADCRRHYARELAAHPVRPAAASQDTLSRWLVDLHNRVNVRLGKPTLPYDAVEAEYRACDMACAGTTASDTEPACCVPPHNPLSESASGTSTHTGENPFPWIMAAVAFLLGGLLVAALGVMLRKRRAHSG